MGIAGNAGANDILPSRRTSAISWNHVIQIEIFPVENTPAILASILISFENIVSRKLNLFLWQSVKKEKQNDTRNPHLK